MKTFALFAVLSSFSLNLVLQTGLGRDLVYKDLNLPLHKRLSRWIALFITVLLFWLLWTYVLYPLTLTFFDVVFIFPFCAFFYFLIDRCVFVFGNWLEKNFSKPENTRKNNKAFLRGDGEMLLYSVPLCVFSLYMTLRLAGGIGEAAILAFFFSAGCFFSVLVLKAIRTKVHLERADKKNLGIPIAYISMGLLAFVFHVFSSVLL
jgi:Na+-transporting NADH:ubiquinone oxidoreductase subunit NqrE